MGDAGFLLGQYLTDLPSKSTVALVERFCRYLADDDACVRRPFNHSCCDGSYFGLHGSKSLLNSTKANHFQIECALSLMLDVSRFTIHV